MRWLLVTAIICAVTTLGVGTSVAQYDHVDIGDVESEDTHSMTGWGPIEPDASGGSYGGVENCRVVYAPGEPPEECWASLVMDFGPEGGPTDKCIVARHLDGMSGADAFEVYVNDNYVGSYTDDDGGGENWIVSEFDVTEYSGLCTIKLVSTEDCWPSFETYGQVAFDEITIMDCTPTSVDEPTWGTIKTLYR
jgi:hypothetical protein